MGQPTGKGSRIAGALAAIGVSVCCVGPLVLLALGVGGTWIGNLTAMEPYRPFKIDYAKKTTTVTYNPEEAQPAGRTLATTNAGCPSVAQK